ncbi:hypothetical protein P7C70_g5330, partial [Phenoliferia sp. Uapishka_3]
MAHSPYDLSPLPTLAPPAALESPTPVRIRKAHLEVQVKACWTGRGYWGGVVSSEILGVALGESGGFWEARARFQEGGEGAWLEVFILCIFVHATISMVSAKGRAKVGTRSSFLRSGSDDADFARAGSSEKICGFQHALAMLAGLIAPPIIMAGNLGFDAKQQNQMVAVSLIAAGILSCVQMSRFPIPFTRRKYWIGTDKDGTCPMITVDGTSTRGPCPEAYGYLLGTSALCSLLEMGISFCSPKTLRRIFPPVVTGTVVVLIGASLVGSSGFLDWGGGSGDCSSRPTTGLYQLCPNINAPHALQWGDARYIGLGFLSWFTISTRHYVPLGGAFSTKGTWTFDPSPSCGVFRRGDGSDWRHFFTYAGNNKALEGFYNALIIILSTPYLIAGIVCSLLNITLPADSDSLFREAEEEDEILAGQVSSGAVGKESEDPDLKMA